MAAVQPVWSRPMTNTVSLPFAPSSVREGRRIVAIDLKASSVPETERTDILLVVSELLSNAIRHARPLEQGGVRLMWRVFPDEVEVAVADGGAATHPRAERPPFAALSGRGLGIVDTLTDSWGSEGAGTHQQLVWGVVRRASGIQGSGA